MDICDLAWDELIQSSMDYITFLEGRFKYISTNEQKEYFQFIILKEKTLVNLMNGIEHIKPHDIYNIPFNSYIEALCKLELENRAITISLDKELKKNKDKTARTKENKPVRTNKFEVKKEKELCRELSRTIR